jgi:hypothetical protein
MPKLTKVSLLKAGDKSDAHLAGGSTSAEKSANDKFISQKPQINQLQKVLSRCYLHNFLNLFVLIDAIRPGAGAEGSTNGATFGRAGADSAADRRTPAGNVALVWYLIHIIEHSEHATAKCSSKMY